MTTATLSPADQGRLTNHPWSLAFPRLKDDYNWWAYILLHKTSSAANCTTAGLLHEAEGASWLVLSDHFKHHEWTSPHPLHHAINLWWYNAPISLIMCELSWKNVRATKPVRIWGYMKYSVLIHAWNWWRLHNIEPIYVTAVSQQCRELLRFTALAMHQGLSNKHHLINTMVLTDTVQSTNHMLLLRYLRLEWTRRKQAGISMTGLQDWMHSW